MGQPCTCCPGWSRRVFDWLYRCLLDRLCGWSAPGPQIWTLYPGFATRYECCRSVLPALGQPNGILLSLDACCAYLYLAPRRYQQNALWKILPLFITRLFSLVSLAGISRDAARCQFEYTQPLLPRFRYRHHRSSSRVTGTLHLAACA